MTEEDAAALADAAARGGVSLSEFLDAQPRAPRRGRTARMLGKSPLTVEGRSWFWAAFTEVGVCRSLAPLLPQHLVLHGVGAALGAVPIGHLVVGPTGTYAVHSVDAAGGEAAVTALTLRIAGHPMPELRQAQHSVGAVERCLGEAVGGEVRATAVLVIARAESLTVIYPPRDLVVLDAPQLSKWIQRRPTILNPERAAALAAAAARPMTWAGTPAGVCGGTGEAQEFDRILRDVLLARRIRRLWILAGSLALAALLAWAILAAAR